jgi:two-component system cell cycle response regulator DivK
VRQKVILSVEDNAANRRIVRDLFERKGYRVVEAVNGEDGLAVAARERPDVILMDVQLPRMSGYDAARALKSNPQLCRIPIIAVTSYALSGDEQKAHDAGCDGYVTKPFRPRMLLEMVEKYLRMDPPGSAP